MNVPLGSILCAVVLSGAANAQANEDSSAEVQALRDRVSQLESKLAQIEQHDAQWLTEARAEQIRDLVGDVLADADARTSLQSSGMTAGWDKGFFLASPDASFRLNIVGLIQFRYIFNHQDGSGIDTSRGGFENSRTRLTFSGNVFDKTWIYRVQGQFSSAEDARGQFELLDCWGGKVLGDNWAILAGQFKVPVVHEWALAPQNQLVLEQSLVSNRLGAGYTQGVVLAFHNDFLKFLVSYNDGAGETGGQNQPWSFEDTEYAFTGRVEGKLAGDWAAYDSLTSFRGDPFTFVLGGGAHYQSGEYGTDLPELELFQWSADATALFGGWNLYGSFIGRHLSNAVSADIYGATVQGGFFLTDKWELYGRYEWGDDDSSAADLSILTIGTNYYFAKEGVKLSGDFGYGFNAVAPYWVEGANLTGWRADVNGDDGQWVVRTQLQLQF